MIARGDKLVSISGGYFVLAVSDEADGMFSGKRWPRMDVEHYYAALDFKPVTKALADVWNVSDYLVEPKSR